MIKQLTSHYIMFLNKWHTISLSPAASPFASKNSVPLLPHAPANQNVKCRDIGFGQSHPRNPNHTIPECTHNMVKGRLGMDGCTTPMQRRHEDRAEAPLFGYGASPASSVMLRYCYPRFSTPFMFEKNLNYLSCSIQEMERNRGSRFRYPFI